MSSLPPIDGHDNKMLPAVYRRSDIIRSVNVTGRQSPRGWSEGQIISANDGADRSGGYTRSRNDSPAVIKPGNPCPKGMLIDVWA